MGGQSFKCPHCDKWFLSKGQLHDHLKGRHGFNSRFEIIGIGSATGIKPLEGFVIDGYSKLFVDGLWRLVRKEAPCRKVNFIVSLELPQHITEHDMAEYIAEAVTTWCKSLRPPGSYAEDDPGDPLFYLDGDTVTVEYDNGAVMSHKDA
jgi:hypothetical protein